MGKDNFILYGEQEQLLEDLNDAQTGRIFKAIFEYERTQIVPQLSQVERLVFKSFKISLDKNREKYEKVVERNKANGKKGGRPKNPNNPSGFSENPKEPKKADNDNDNDNDNEYLIGDIYTPPTLDEVKKFAEDEELKKVNVDYFYKYQTFNGWKDKEGNYINWKTYLMAWNKNEREDKKEIPNGLDEIYEN